MSTILTASSIGQLSAPLSAANQAADAIVIFHTIIDFPKPVYGTATDVSAAGDITLENVNFAYPTRPEVKILNGLNVTFPAGKVTAIVGPSGSGKSTIVGIIQRWYEFNGDPVLNPLVSTHNSRKGRTRNVAEVDRFQIGPLFQNWTSIRLRQTAHRDRP